MFNDLIDPIAKAITSFAAWIVAHPEHAHRAAEWLVGILALWAGQCGVVVKLWQWLGRHRQALLRVAEAIQGAGDKGQAVKDSLRRDPLPGPQQAALSSIVAVVKPDQSPAALWKRLLIMLLPWIIGKYLKPYVEKK